MLHGTTSAMVVTQSMTVDKEAMAADKTGFRGQGTVL